MWYPFDGGNVSTKSLDGVENVSVAIKPDDAPKPDELVDWIQSEKDLDVEQTLKLGFAPFSLDESGTHRTIVLDAMRYVDKGNVRWGVGMRLVLHAWSEKGSVLGSVALVAAQASLNMAYTRATFEVLGCKSPDLSPNYPGFEEMTVTNYAKLMKSIDDCRNALNAAIDAGTADLRPEPVAVSLPALPPEDRSSAWKLFHIHHQQR